jgi:N6-L-threonylcarbamoyladenine synthase
MHAEWIQDVVNQALEEADCDLASIDGIAVTAKPGLAGALLVGISFAKALAWSTGKPFIGINHILAHLYAPLLADDIAYPFIGLIVSGGHSLICRADGVDDITILGATIDDAAGEAFDKVAKHYNLGYPGGVAIDRLARKGDARACRFPVPFLYKGKQKTYDVSYSGLKTAAIRQLDQFWNPEFPKTDENLAAAFEKAAVDMLCDKLLAAARDLGITTVVAGGGVAANSYLRSVLASHPELCCYFPPLVLCGDNGAMVAGLGYHLLARGDRDGLDLNAAPRVAGFRRLKA